MLIDRAGLAADEHARLAAEVAEHHTLGHLVRWCAAQRPLRNIVEIVTQDEYTHDVVVPYSHTLHLVYDTT